MHGNLRLRVAVIDDEPLARSRIEDLLSTDEQIEIVGTAGNGRKGVELIRSTRPDIVFLDVQMPGMSGLDLARTLGSEMPVTVFVTAYDSFALDAFEVAAVDYLVKPFDDDRFHQALARARRTIELQRVEESAAASPAGSEPPHREAGEAPHYLERIAIEARGEVRSVAVEEIEYITASGPYAEIHTRSRTHLLRERMQTLEQRLDPAKFLRIHRSTIVRAELIEAFLRQPGGDYSVRLRGGLELSVSRSRRSAVERHLGLQPHH